MLNVLLWAAGGIVLLLAAAYYAVCRRMIGIALERGKVFDAGIAEGYKTQIDEHRDLIDAGAKLFDSLDGEDKTMTSFDGLKLHAKFFKNGDGKRVILAAHGFRSNGRHDFGAVLPFYYETLGYSLLVIDQRAHGESEGKYITYGVCERFDIRDWAHALVEWCGDDVQIILDGISMGATAVLMSTALDLPKQVCGVVADCGFTSPWDIFRHILAESFHLGAFPTLYIVEKMARRRAHFGFRDASTLDAMQICKLPVLFVHGEDDDFVPCEMSEAAYEVCAAKKKELVLVEGAQHGCSYLCDRARCEETLRRFLREITEK